MENTNKQTLHQYVQGLLRENGGVTITGNPLERSIHIENRLLDLEDSLEYGKYGEGFDWGYIGSKPTQLALALALVLEPTASQALEIFDTLKKVLVAALPNDHFKVYVNYNKLREAIKSTDLNHPYDFLEIHHEGVKFSKWLDLGNLGFNCYQFTKGSIEYQEIEKVQNSGNLEALNLYLKHTTHRRMVTSIKKVYMELYKVEDTWCARHGLGSGLGKGHEIGTFCKIK